MSKKQEEVDKITSYQKMHGYNEFPPKKSFVSKFFKFLIILVVIMILIAMLAPEFLQEIG